MNDALDLSLCVHPYAGGRMYEKAFMCPPLLKFYVEVCTTPITIHVTRGKKQEISGLSSLGQAQSLALD